MNKLIWVGIIGGGVLATAAGFGALDPAPAGVDGAPAAPALAALLLLTGGMAGCLAGVLGLTGLMGWIPGLETAAAPAPAE
ncbi:hypothetical protein ACFDR9_003001 [Janthinobacterium sp. CG_23.3]|uniref:hypothetical protein n=1 Tax=unclassified Janthinobacterium TaxID=2610881 RepID=UPI0003459C19|nr:MULTISPECIES: hypothetical protein [unclassified Janthinobacterium]MEC5163809.1 hypothetical protein [Janthinobacterium sp. CG_S6]